MELLSLSAKGVSGICGNIIGFVTYKRDVARAEDDHELGTSHAISIGLVTSKSRECHGRGTNHTISIGLTTRKGRECHKETNHNISTGYVQGKRVSWAWKKNCLNRQWNPGYRLRPAINTNWTMKADTRRGVQSHSFHFVTSIVWFVCVINFF